jgi:hypothetical protein
MAHPDDARRRSGDPGESAAGDGAAGDGGPGAELRSAGVRRHLVRCWRLECDIDPLILRVRLLHGRGARRLAISLEQELLPFF